MTRRPRTWAAGCFYLVGCALLVATLVELHLDGDGHQVLIGVLAGVCALAALILMVGRFRESLLVSLAAVALGLAVVTAAAGSAENLGGLLASSFGFLWAAVYVAYFFERPMAYALTALIAACVGAALAVSGVPDPGLAGVVVVVTVAAGVFVLRRLVELLEHEAQTDALTGLLNRNGLEVELGRLRRSGSRPDGPVSVAVIDVDDFSAVNNRDGHLAADHLLKQLAGQWKEALGPRGVLARIGGDEFLVVLPERSLAAAEGLLGELRGRSAAPWSAGVVEVAEHESFPEAVARADRLLLSAKQRRPRRRSRSYTQSHDAPPMTDRAPESA